MMSVWIGRGSQAPSGLLRTLPGVGPLSLAWWAAGTGPRTGPSVGKGRTPACQEFATVLLGNSARPGFTQNEVCFSYKTMNESSHVTQGKSGFGGERTESDTEVSLFSSWGQPPPPLGHSQPGEAAPGGLEINCRA